MDQIDDLIAENERLTSAIDRLASSNAFVVATSNVSPEALARLTYAELILGGMGTDEADKMAETAGRKRAGLSTQ